MSNRVAAVLQSLAASAARNVAVRVFENDRRWSPRRLSALAGLAISNKLPGAVPCIVRDVSATGAQIELISGKGDAAVSVQTFPERFLLRLLRDNSDVQCEVAWTTQKVIGVRFMSAFQERAPVVKAKPAAKRGWL